MGKKYKIFQDKYGYLNKNKEHRAEEDYTVIFAAISYMPIIGGITLTVVGGGLATLGLGFLAFGLAAAAVSAGLAINTAINKNNSRKLFKAINKGNVKEIESRIDKISKKTKRNKKHILNDMRDKNGNSLIVSIINSDKINQNKKEELINKLIKNGAKIEEKNATFGKTGRLNEKKINGATPIEIVKNMKESKDKTRMIKFLSEKYRERLENINNKIKKLSGWRRFFNKSRIKKLNKKAEYIKNINNEVFNNFKKANNDINKKLNESTNLSQSVY